jgi:hypothetical protein
MKSERPTVIPAKAGIQKFSISWIPGRFSCRQLARNDAQIIHCRPMQEVAAHPVMIRNDFASSLLNCRD